MASLEDSRPSKRQCAASICPIAMDQRLPVELLTRLLYALPPHSAVALGRANKLLHRIVSQEALYWRECYRQRYGGEVCRQGFTGAIMRRSRRVWTPRPRCALFCSIVIAIANKGNVIYRRTGMPHIGPAPTWSYDGSEVYRQQMLAPQLFLVFVC
ncbi:hypothetical protein BDF19DRAFT_140354 [Syncephalis fuscata]|nr:hypothetical protein BDF19DRAFT_140354 [Syncephalis fuscata]